MKYQHRATPEQWQAIEANGHLPTRSTILELLCRIEALEATQHAHVDLSHLSDAEREKAARELMQAAGFAPRWPAVAFAPRWSEFERCAAIVDSLNEAKPVDSPPQPNHPEIPDSSLKERIKSLLIQCVGSTWDKTTASVLVEVAAWLQKHYGGPTATTHLLEQEAKR